ncbi:hypothetical protein KKG90_08420 [Candidatus Bipolaricaulota bacterium]|nr:hypothetical protein [Candidatus Bipolaricaulota bacterium]
MELEQWIHLFGAISSTTTAREKSKWMVFSGAVVACSILVLGALWALIDAAEPVIGLGTAVLGFLISVIWGIVQSRLHAECSHWQRLLRSIESQFAGTEFHRSIHRLLLGEQVSVPGASWICGEWNPEAARFSAITRHLSQAAMLWIPGLFSLAFIALIVATIIQ